MTTIAHIQTLNYPFLNTPLEIYTTDRGHTIIFAKKEGGMVNISTWVKTGSINENTLCLKVPVHTKQVISIEF